MSDFEDADSHGDEEALAEMIAGYNGKKARGAMPPADEISEKQEEKTEVISDLVEPIHQDEEEQKKESESIEEPEISVADELKALKAKVSSLASNVDPDIVRRMHGEIGEINRSIKQLQSQPQPKKEDAPAKEDELAAALKSMESVADEFPDFGLPLVKALKALQESQKSAVAQQNVPDDLYEKVLSKVEEKRNEDAIDYLAARHPDFETVRTTEEYRKWLSSKPQEYQNVFSNTWNPMIVCDGLDDFKKFKTAQKVREEEQQKREKKLALAVAPKGTQQKAKPSTISDDEAFLMGYNKRRIHNKF